MDVLDNATLWVGISFLIFVLLIFKPLLNSISASLDKKIDSIKDNITEAKELKEEAEKIFILHEEKQKNIRSFKISSNILRVETAPVVALAKLNY